MNEAHGAPNSIRVSESPLVALRHSWLKLGRARKACAHARILLAVGLKFISEQKKGSS